MNALLSRLSLSAEIVVDLVEDESLHPLLNTVRVGAVGNRARHLTFSFMYLTGNVSDIAPAEVVFNERRFGYLDYSHHVSFTELAIISPRSDLPSSSSLQF